MTLATLPKVELHLHIEGAAPPALVRDLAARKGLTTEGLFDAHGAYAWSGFTGFLAAYDRAAAIFVTPDEHRDLAEAVLLDAASHGVIYTEMAISPDHAAEGDRHRWDDYLAAISEGAEAAERAAGIVARFIPTCIRGLGPDRALHAARLAAEAQHPRIVALGLAGDERIFRPADFAPAFDLAREAGLKLTAHAGEFGGPESVRAALDGLRVDRIDHGVRAIEDPALLARIIDQRVHLALCPGSNIALGVHPDWASHPIRQLRGLGVDLSVSTDDPPFFHTDMTREYEMLAQTFGWTDADFRALAEASLAAAFCDEATRARLAPRLAA